MRLNNFLNELKETRTKAISNNKAIEIINKNCTDILKYYQKNNQYIYRGAPGGPVCLFTDPTKGKLRKSRDIPNYYTLLFDNLPAWKLYPKRSKSLICTSNLNDARGFGVVYVVFPYNNAKIGVCPSSDIWSVFQKYLHSLSFFATHLKNLLKDFLDYIPDDNSWNSLQKDFKKVEKIIKDKEYTDDEIQDIQYEKIYGDVFKTWVRRILKGEKFTDVFNDILDPKKNYFKIIKVGDKLPPLKEVWTDSKCVLILESEIDDFMEQYNEI